VSVSISCFIAEYCSSWKGEVSGSGACISFLGRAFRENSFEKAVDRIEVRESRMKKGKL